MGANALLRGGGAPWDEYLGVGSQDSSLLTFPGAAGVEVRAAHVVGIARLPSHLQKTAPDVSIGTGSGMEKECMHMTCQ